MNNKDNMDMVAANLNINTDHDARLDEMSSHHIEQSTKMKPRKSAPNVETMDHGALKSAAPRRIEPATPALRLYRIISLVLSTFMQIPLGLLPSAQGSVFWTIGTIISIINYIVLTIFWVPAVLILLDFLLLASGLQHRSFVLYGLLLVFKYNSSTLNQLLRDRVLPMLLSALGAPPWAVSILQKIPLPQIPS